jgi:hypothetical protein
MELISVEINKLGGWIVELGQVKVTNGCLIKAGRNTDFRISAFDVSDKSGIATLEITLGGVIRTNQRATCSNNEKEAEQHCNVLGGIIQQMNKMDK